MNNSNGASNSSKAFWIVAAFAISPLSHIVFWVSYGIFAGLGGWYFLYVGPIMAIYALLGLACYITTIITSFSDKPEKKTMVLLEFLRSLPLFFIGFIGIGIDDTYEQHFLARKIHISGDPLMTKLADIAVVVFSLGLLAVGVMTLIAVVMDLMMLSKTRKSKLG
jgi:hypothetical protein